LGVVSGSASDQGSTYRLVDYRVRAARITDVDRLVALSGDRLGGRAPGQLDAADILRQLVFLPHASVLVAERRRELVGGAVLAIRPSVRAGGYVGTIDLLVVDPSAEVDAVTDLLVEEAVRSAANKGCATVEAPQPGDPAERARWERLGFTPLDRRLGRVVAAAGSAGRRTT
jgi:GNAT superfamily N-acetyltransferase